MTPLALIPGDEGSSYLDNIEFWQNIRPVLHYLKQLMMLVSKAVN